MRRACSSRAAVAMARKNNQAREGRTEAARRLTEDSGGCGSRVGTTAEEAEGEEANNTTSSKRSRRAAQRGQAVHLDTSAAANADGGRAPGRHEEEAIEDMDSESGDCHMTPAAGPVVSENYYTAVEGEAEGDSDGEPSEAPSIKSPHKPRKAGSRGGQTQDNGTGRRAP